MGGGGGGVVRRGACVVSQDRGVVSPEGFRRIVSQGWCLRGGVPGVSQDGGVVSRDGVVVSRGGVVVSRVVSQGGVPGVVAGWRCPRCPHGSRVGVRAKCATLFFH